MRIMKIFLVLVFSHCAFSGKIRFQECGNISDQVCIKNKLEQFFREYSGGSTENNLKSIDPLVIPFLEVKDEDLGIVSEFTNMKVRGFKNVEIFDVNTDLTKEHNDYKMKFNFVAESDLTVTILSAEKSFSGSVFYSGNVEGRIEYNIIQIKIENSRVHIDLGPETITCECKEAESTLSDELASLLSNDEDAEALKSKYEKSSFDHRKKVACEIAKRVFEAAVGSLRALARGGSKDE